ncbi:hypothetical protein OFC56_32035, partial [Escherichia coli]|nr:hypothetical protein [Escherichia coli]
MATSTSRTVFRSTRRRLLAAAPALGLAAAAAPSARAQGRKRVTRIIVPFAPGGGNDVFARQLAHSLNAMTQKDVIVENKPGAGGNL